MRMPGQVALKKEVVDPLRSLMKQMGLKMGPDIIEATGTAEDARAPKVEKLPPLVLVLGLHRGSARPGQICEEGRRGGITRFGHDVQL